MPESSSLQEDILRVFHNLPKDSDGKLRPFEIREQLKQVDSRYRKGAGRYSSDRSFDVKIAQSLSWLVRMDLLEKDGETHHYQLKDASRGQVEEIVEKTNMEKTLRNAMLQKFEISASEVEDAWRTLYGEESGFWTDFALRNVDPEIADLLFSLFAEGIAREFRLQLWSPLYTIPPIVEEPDLIQLLTVAFSLTKERMTGNKREYLLTLSYKPAPLDPTEWPDWFKEECEKRELDPADPGIREAWQAFQKWNDDFLARRQARFHPDVSRRKYLLTTYMPLEEATKRIEEALQRLKARYIEVSLEDVAFESRVPLSWKCRIDEDTIPFEELVHGLAMRANVKIGTQKVERPVIF